jgi:SOS response regulatory protein OraA/RecX
MAQIAEADVRKALRDLGDTEEGGAGPLLPPEQVERIAAIAQEKDPLVKGEKTAAMIEQLVREAEAGSERLAQLQRRLGLEPGQSKAFLGGGRLNDQARQQVQSAMDAFKREVLDEVDREAKHALGSGKARTAKPPRAGRLTV